MQSQTQSNITQPIIRPARPEDDAQSLALFNRAFKATVEADYWDWKYRQLPYGEPIISVAVSADGNIVGHSAILPQYVNLSGRRLAAGQCVDSFVSEEHRSQGVYIALAEHTYRAAHDAGIRILFGFPTAKVLPIKLAKLSFLRAGTLSHYRMRLAIRSEVARRLPSATLANGLDMLYRAWQGSRLSAGLRSMETAVAGLSLQRSRQVPACYEAFWKRISPTLPLSVWKDSDYLSWRYDANPKPLFEYVWVTRRNEAVAFAVVFRDGEEARLCELMALDHDPIPARFLVSIVTRELVQEGKLRRLTLDGSDLSFFGSALAPWNAKPQAGSAYCTRILQGAPLNLELWTLTLGDCDSF